MTAVWKVRLMVAFWAFAALAIYGLKELLR